LLDRPWVAEPVLVVRLDHGLGAADRQQATDERRLVLDAEREQRASGLLGQRERQVGAGELGERLTKLAFAGQRRSAQPHPKGERGQIQ
jgi:hypothetical protein